MNSITAPKIPKPTDGGPARRFSKARPLAARFGICPRTLFRFADRGLLHRFKLNARVVVFAEDEVEALFEAARVSTTANTTKAATMQRGGEL